MPKTQLTRRALIGRAAASAAIAGVTQLGTGGVAQADAAIGTFALDPTQGGTCTTGSCVSCQSCRSHAANKLFRTADAADAGRAHPGCRCTVIAGEPFSQATVTNIFAQADMADRRYTQTAHYLNGEVEQREVPLATGLMPLSALVSGGAVIWWLAHQRHPDAGRGAGPALGPAGGPASPADIG